MDGVGYLRKLIEDRLRDLGEVPNEARGLTAGILSRELHGAAWALVAAGALDRSTAETLLRELEDLLLSRGFLERVEVSGKGVSHQATAEFRAEAVGGRRPSEWERTLDERSVPELVRVIAVGRQLRVLDERRLVVLSVELWSTGINLRSTLIPAPRPSVPPTWPPAPSWEAWADDGVRCQGRGGGMHGSEVFVAEHWLRPAPSARATVLIVVARTPEGSEVGRFDIPL